MQLWDEGEMDSDRESTLWMAYFFDVTQSWRVSAELLWCFFGNWLSGCALTQERGARSVLSTFWRSVQKLTGLIRVWLRLVDDEDAASGNASCTRRKVIEGSDPSVTIAPTFQICTIGSEAATHWLVIPSLSHTVGGVKQPSQKAQVSSSRNINADLWIGWFLLPQSIMAASKKNF